VPCAASEDVLTSAKKALLLDNIIPAAIVKLQEALTINRVSGNLVGPSSCSYHNVPAAHASPGLANVDYILYVSGAPSGSTATRSTRSGKTVNEVVTANVAAKAKAYFSCPGLVGSESGSQHCGSEHCGPRHAGFRHAGSCHAGANAGTARRNPVAAHARAHQRHLVVSHYRGDGGREYRCAGEDRHCGELPRRRSAVGRGVQYRHLRPRVSPPFTFSSLN
jgi:hypothetical protein